MYRLEVCVYPSLMPQVIFLLVIALSALPLELGGRRSMERVWFSDGLPYCTCPEKLKDHNHMSMFLAQLQAYEPF